MAKLGCSVFQLIVIRGKQILNGICLTAKRFLLFEVYCFLSDYRLYQNVKLYETANLYVVVEFLLTVVKCTMYNKYLLYVVGFFFIKFNSISLIAYIYCGYNICNCVQQHQQTKYLICVTEFTKVTRSE